MKFGMKSSLIFTLLCCFVFVGAVCAGAEEAKTHTWFRVDGNVDFKPGVVLEPDYGTVDEILYFLLNKTSGNSAEDEDKKGTLTIPAASYFYRDAYAADAADVEVKDSDGPKTFDVICTERTVDAATGNTTDMMFEPLVYGTKNAVTGLRGKTVTWDFTDFEGMTVPRSGTIPSGLLSTEEQLALAVPYVKVEGNTLTLRSVLPSDVTTAVDMPYDGRFNLSVFSKEPLKDSRYVDSEDFQFTAGQPIEKTFSLSDFEVNDAKYVTRVRVMFQPAAFSWEQVNEYHSNFARYRWNFRPLLPASTVESNGENGTPIVIGISKNVNGNVIKIHIGTKVYVWFSGTTNPPSASLYGLGAKAAEAADEVVYGPYEVTVETEGELAIDVNNLKPAPGADAASAPASLPVGTYSKLWYESTDGEWVGEVDGLSVTGTGDGHRSSSGCDIASGAALLVVPLAALLKRKK